VISNIEEPPLCSLENFEMPRTCSCVCVGSVTTVCVCVCVREREREREGGGRESGGIVMPNKGCSEEWPYGSWFNVIKNSALLSNHQIHSFL
jgi:hypothetical protein